MEDFNIHFHQWTDHPENINNETRKLVYIIDQMDLTDNYETFHPTSAEYGVSPLLFNIVLKILLWINLTKEINKWNGNGKGARQIIVVYRWPEPIHKVTNKFH